MMNLNDNAKTLIQQCSSRGILLEELLTEIRKQFIIAVLKSNRGRMGSSAVQLGMHRNTLIRHLKELKISRKEFIPKTLPRLKTDWNLYAKEEYERRWNLVEQEVRANGIRCASIKFGIGEARVSQILRKMREVRRQQITAD